MKKHKKVISSLLVVSVIVSLGPSSLAANGYAAEKIKGSSINNTNKLQVELNEKEMEELVEIIKTEKDNFNDPSYANEIIDKLEKNSSINDNKNGYETNGKATLAAKAGVAAAKAAMKKIGKPAWNKMVSKIESATGFEVVAFHWQAINKTLNIVANSGDTFTSAITKYLVSQGFNRFAAGVLARAFVTVFL
ncbi:hypothetical protein SZL87_10690 [Exiguobacterium indicum]|uniref:Uncharacterized protein n=1 Tax=Exiguobacterium indicum TaxID=296995 RepID=A0ABU8EIZ5_9BACL|nr:hypothetical protein [Exiguobacterium indicum]